MARLATSFVPILAVMSGHADQLAARQASAEEIESSLTALLGEGKTAWMGKEIAQFGQEMAKNGPDLEGNAGEMGRNAPPALEGAKDASNSSISEQTEPAEPLQMDADGLTADDALIEGRRRPGVQKRLPDPIVQNNPGAVSAPPPEAFPTDEFPVPDRWRIM